VNSNQLFVICTIYVPIMMITLLYPQIHDFYAYSVPLNNLVLTPDPPSEYFDFDKTKQEEGSECFITPNNNHYCYAKPKNHEGEQRMVSYVIGENNIVGEIHFDPVDIGVGYFTIKNMIVLSGDTVLVTLSDKNYRIGNEASSTYEITDKFEFSTVLKKFDTFVTLCGHYEKTGVTIVQYLGVQKIDGVNYFLTWHMPAHTDKELNCKYPEIILHSLNHKFREL
jgi:hypothetical protein